MKHIINELLGLFEGFWFFTSPRKLYCLYFLDQNGIIPKVTSPNFCFFVHYVFSLADNDTDIWKTHLNKAEQIIRLNFYLRIQNTDVDKLFEDCSENIDAKGMSDNDTSSDYEKLCNYCTIHIIIIMQIRKLNTST